jgi:uncharacterized protein YyaL (SSP411 family)
LVLVNPEDNSGVHYEHTDTKTEMELLDQITEKWNDDREKIVEAGDQIVAETQKRMLSNLQGEISAKSLEKAYGMYEQMFDPMYGGFGTAPLLFSYRFPIY